MEKVTVKELLEKDIREKVVAFPTDTVYGVGCIYNDEVAIKKIYELKNRDYSKPLAILTPSSDIAKYITSESEKANELMDKYWPGALTIIFKKSNLIPDIATSNKDTVGFRMPNSKIALSILKKFGIMTTTSINISGMSPLNDPKEIEKEFGEKIDYLVTEEEILSSVSSTVVDATGEEIKILRQGDIKL